MRIYLDVCCLNRPFDDQTQDRIHLEAEAIITIQKNIEFSNWTLVGSSAIDYEIDKTIDNERRVRLQTMAQTASEFVLIDAGIESRARQIATFGIGTFDALHVACAERARVDAMLTTDDKLIKTVKQHLQAFRIRVANPLIWLEEIL
jgi:hypothetical protein